MAKIGIFYGSTEGNTERVVNQIQEKLGGEAEAALHNVNSSSADDMQPYAYLILACPTWEIGQLQEDWDSFIDELGDVDYAGKKVTYVGLGDADGYPDTFLDAMAIIYEASKGVVDGKFLGLAIDEDNQNNLTAKRVEDWVALIKPEFQ